MQHVVKRMPRLLAAFLCAALMMPALVRGQASERADDDAGAAKPAAGKPAVMAVVAVRSFDALKPVAKDLGIPLPAFLTAEGVGQMFPFLGEESIDPDRPVGMLFFGGKDVTQATMGAFQIPLKPGVDPLKALAGAGKMMPGHPDTLVAEANGFGFRRAKGSLIFGAQADAVAALDESVVNSTVPGKGTIAAGWIDVAAFRKAMPEQFDAFIKQLEDQAAAKTPDERKGAEMATAFFRDKLNKVEIAVEQSTAGMRLSTTVRPFGVKTAGPLPLAAMPAGVVARLDIGVRPMDVFPIDKAVLEKLAESDKEATPAERKAFVQAADDMVKLFYGADGMSLGIEPSGDAAVGYIVLQRRKPFEFDKQWRAVVQEIQTLTAESKKESEPEVKIESYDAEGGVKATRVMLVPRAANGGATIYIDSIEKGNTAYVTIAAESGKHVGKFAAMKQQGQMSELASGYFDLGGLVSALEKHPSNPLGGLDENQQKKLLELLKDQKLTFSSSSKGDGLTFDITIPRELMKNVPALMEIAQ